MNLIKCAILLSMAGLLYACAFTHPEWNSQAYTVKPQDTLYSIAWRYDLDYREVAHWNSIPPPYTIYPGQRIRLQPSVKHRVAVPTETQPLSAKTVATTPIVREESVPGTWAWPAQGRIAAYFDNGKNGLKGIDIAGRLGQAIYAAADGKIVYSGDGLIGYGKLIIVKHNESYLSAYAHNHKLLVQEGEQVKLGQQIAEMGHKQDGAVHLYFEIRKLGMPVDPLKYLPKR